MPDYKPIPTPPSQYWRFFRTRSIPVIVFATAVVAIAWLWDQESAPGAMIGEVYAPAGTLNAPRDGWIEGGPVEMFRKVQAGEEIAVIRTIPPEHASLTLTVLHEEIRMIRLGVGDNALDQKRNQFSLQSLRRDWLLARSDLASLRVNMRQAEADAIRLERLSNKGGESQSAMEQARAMFESMVAEEAEKSRLVDSLEAAVNGAGAISSEGIQPDIAAGIDAALAWKEAELRKLEAELAPVSITAPFSGHLTRIFRHTGDFVSLGEAIAEIRSRDAESIIGYMKAPFPMKPEVGMEVEIVPRSGGRSAASRASVVSVGPQFEALQPAFMRPLPVSLEERALPIHISLPDDIPFVPGDIVDIRIPRPTR